MYLSQLRISRDPSVSALKALIDPSQRGEAIDAHHRLVWSAFTGNDDRNRDFLWRKDTNGNFITLSRERPGRSPFFDEPVSKAFDPDLSIGTRLAFVLRANATHTIKDATDLAPNGQPRRRKHDVVMHALRGVDPSDRHRMRHEVAQEAGRAWLERQGARNGFDLASAIVEGYTTQTAPGGRGRRKGKPHFGILDIKGVLEVTDPDVFIEALRRGFGGAKSFGCGLMMIKRAS